MDSSWISKWNGLTVFVLGDVMLDKYVYGRIERISPEAPIPVLRHQSEKSMLGGAGNVARNIVALGGKAVLAGALGDDPEGVSLTDALAEGEGIVGKFIRLEGHPTTTKVRYVAGGQQILRLDIEQVCPLEADGIDVICDGLLEEIADISAIVLSDYAKGLLVPELARRVIDIARSHNVPVVVDPKTCDVARYAGATVLTPNAQEAALISGVDCVDDDHAALAAKLLQERAGVGSVVVTRGAQGMTVFDPAESDGAIAHVHTSAVEVFDVSGAGDTVVAVMALALASGASVQSAARIGNAAAGISVGKRGTAVVQARELAAALGDAKPGDNPKIVDSKTAAEIVADWKAHGLRIGFTNGCFDLLHPGHVELLKRSRTLCDRLVVALNADVSVRRVKGETRPLQNEHARSVVMAAMDCVDLVTLFEEDTPLRLIELFKPDYLVKGADYTVATVVGAEFVHSYGGKVVLVPLQGGHSTTSILARAHGSSGRQLAAALARRAPDESMPQKSP